MPGDYCSVVGCRTSRSTGISIFKLPQDQGDLKTKQWRAAVLNFITKDRVVDKKFQAQIDNDRVRICARHFTEDSMWHYVSRKALKEGAIPTLHAPQKSIQTAPKPERSTSSINKRITVQAQQQKAALSIPTPPAYKDYDNFVKRVEKLSLPPSWSLIIYVNYVAVVKKNQEFVLPEFEIFTNSSLNIVVRYFGWMLPLSSLPENSFRKMTLTNFLGQLEGYKVCQGVNLVEPEKAYHLQHHIIPRNFIFDHLSSSQACQPVSEMKFIRASKCSILTHTDGPCQHCQSLSVVTRSQEAKKRKIASTPAAPRAPLSVTSAERLALTVKQNREVIQSLISQNEKLTAQLKASICSRSVPVQKDLSDDLVDIFEGIPEDKVPPFMRLFWTEQQKYLRTDKNHQLRYHPDIIKFCLSISAKSSAAYDQLRLNSKDGSGILVLPSQRTLRNYRNHIKPQQGFDPKIVADLTERTKKFSEREKFVSVVIDEMKVQEDLVWDRSTGKLIGFLDLGDTAINESTISNETKLATHVMVFLVKSVMNPLSFSFATFATDTASSAQIYSLFWKCVSILEISCQLKVIATVADGASTNRRFAKMNRDQDDVKCSEVVYRTINVYAPERYIYFFADAPHLIKTSRNCLWKSGQDGSARFMWNNGFYMIWRHIKDLYKEDIEFGLQLLPHLKSDHIYLNSYSLMRVKLATQILSETTSAALSVSGPKEAKGTANFCLQFDKFFDCFNVQFKRKHITSRKPFLKPYTADSEDEKEIERWKFLNDFLQYLKDWRKSIDERPGDFTPTQRNNMFLSQPTYEGIQMSINSLKEIVPYVLGQGFEYVLTEKFCQDDLENYFGRQRAIGARNDAPNVKQVLSNDSYIKNGFENGPIRGSNCEK
uniref:THAP-type domain-containing protein n=1 Tax=Clytia hemisphaerica TaxID=252671 RepID=A0A7M5VEW6_9CNID